MSQIGLFSKEAKELTIKVKSVKGRKPKEREPDWKWEARKMRDELKLLPLNPKTQFTGDYTHLIIDFDFIMREDLHSVLFLEDENGRRYRERIIEAIEQFGPEKWFIAKGFPISDDSVWKNRYTGTESSFLEAKGKSDIYYLWENWLPKDIWTAEDSFKLGELRKKLPEAEAKVNASREPFNSLLNRWKDYLIKLCAERGQEIDKIWFNESAPYDVSVSLRMKGHHCYSDCVKFRFQKGKLVVYDSGFDGGTSWVYSSNHSDNDRYNAPTEMEEAEVKRIMEKVFSRECDKGETKFFKKEEENNWTQREIITDERGWILD